MPSITIDGPALLEVQMVGRLHGQRVRNVYHYLLRGSLSFADGNGAAEDAASKFMTVVGSPLLLMLSDEYTLEYIQAQWVKPTRYRAVHVPINSPGDSDENSLPSFAAAVLSFNGIGAGRSWTCRKYIAGLPVTVEEDSALTNAAVIALQLIMADALTLEDVGDETHDLHLTCETADSFEGSGLHEVTDGIVRPILRVQRRREIGVGE